MSLKDDIETLEENIDFEYRDCTSNAWSRIKTALKPLMNTDTPKPIIVDYTPVYRCVCGQEWESTSERDQYCPKCDGKMERISE